MLSSLTAEAESAWKRSMKPNADRGAHEKNGQRLSCLETPFVAQHVLAVSSYIAHSVVLCLIARICTLMLLFASDF
jgi:hypothetical protein